MSMRGADGDGLERHVLRGTSAAGAVLPRCRLRQVRSAEARDERLFLDEKGSVLRLQDL